MLRQFFSSVGPCLVLAALLAATAARGEGGAESLEPFEMPAVHRMVSGKVELGPTCGPKTAFSDLKLLITAERSLNYGHAKSVPLAADGLFQVSLQQSYNYRFKLMHAGQQVASGRFEARFPDRVPRMVAQCAVAAPAPAEKPAAAH